MSRVTRTLINGYPVMTCKVAGRAGSGRNSGFLVPSEIEEQMNAIGYVSIGRIGDDALLRAPEGIFESCKEGDLIHVLATLECRA